MPRLSSMHSGVSRRLPWKSAYQLSKRQLESRAADIEEEEPKLLRTRSFQRTSEAGERPLTLGSFWRACSWVSSDHNVGTWLRNPGSVLGFSKWNLLFGVLGPGFLNQVPTLLQWRGGFRWISRVRTLRAQVLHFMLFFWILSPRFPKRGDA